MKSRSSSTLAHGSWCRCCVAHLLSMLYACHEFFHIIEFPAVARCYDKVFPFDIFSGLICCGCCRRRCHNRRMSESLSKDGKRYAITFTFTYTHMHILLSAWRTENKRQTIHFFPSSLRLLLILRMTSLFRSLNHSAEVHTKRDTHTQFLILHTHTHIQILLFIVFAVRFSHSLVPVPFFAAPSRPPFSKYSYVRCVLNLMTTCRKLCLRLFQRSILSSRWNIMWESLTRLRVHPITSTRNVWFSSLKVCIQWTRVHFAKNDVNARACVRACGCVMCMWVCALASRNNICELIRF